MHIEGGFSKVYRGQGVKGFYQKQGSNYSNPHKYDIERLLRKKLNKANPYINKDSTILDLACGSGEVTAPLLQYGYVNIQGTDPYTAEVYQQNTKMQCEKYNFMDILNDCYGEKRFDCIICSYAMHLVKDSLLHDFCNKLSEISKFLIIISPHKFPTMWESYGWNEVESTCLDKIHFRAYKSYNFDKKQQGEDVQKAEERKENVQETVNKEEENKE